MKKLDVKNHLICGPFIEISRKSKSVEAKSRLVVAWGWDGD